MKQILVWDKIPIQYKKIINEYAVFNEPYKKENYELEVNKSIKVQNIPPEIVAIFEELKTISIQPKDTQLLFRNKLPKEGQNFTKTLVSAAHKIQAIYTGNFRSMYRLDPEFLERNSLLISEETWQKLESMKGSWEAVQTEIYLAARRYRQWFWQGNEPEKKDWLITEISQWLFNEYYQSSLFLASLIRKPDLLRETAADIIDFFLLKFA